MAFPWLAVAIAASAYAGYKGQKSLADKMNQPQALQTPEQEAAAKYLLALLQGNAPTIPTAGVAGMTGVEGSAQSMLEQYMAAPTGTGYQTGLSELEKTVAGEAYDPYTSPYWQALREGSMADEEQAVGGLRRGSQMGGMFYSEPSGRTEATLRSQYGTGRMQTLGGLAETERGRQLAAIPQLMQYSQQSPELYKAQMGMMYGGLPREIEQNKLNALYQQQYGQTMLPIEIAGTLKGTPYYSSNQQQGQTPFASGMGAAGQTATMIATLKQLGLF
ncbi:hypothetical protein FP828_03600 [bacterium]|nr:hypothetical protein [Candidatus Omnitrophota bacterium]MBA3065558.1 hypothetical protein [bacterium]